MILLNLEMKKKLLKYFFSSFNNCFAIEKVQDRIIITLTDNKAYNY